MTSTSLPPGPPPPRYHNQTWSLLSQGAEARLWLIPSFFSVSSPSSSSSTSTRVVCKERFPKSYRHPSLDASITRSRTKSEARCLVRCRRAGVPCPVVLSVDAAPTASDASEKNGGEGGDNDAPPTPSTRESSCLFLEYIDGCTVREYIESNSSSSSFTTTNEKEDEDKDDNDEPQKKKARVNEEDDEDNEKNEAKQIVNNNSLQIAYEIGALVASMHNANVVHGDLTTSNIMLRNPPPLPSYSSSTSSYSSLDEKEWKPKLVLIDFGLAGTAGAKGVNHEEKAVDLYVLERAFVSTHPGSDDLVKEIIRAYKGKCKTSDSVLQRLSQVRLRGRKRECFG